MNGLFWPFWWTGEAIGWALLIAAILVGRHASRTAKVAHTTYGRFFDGVDAAKDASDFIDAREQLSAASGHVVVAERLYASAFLDHALARRLNLAAIVVIWSVAFVSMVRWVPS